MICGMQAVGCRSEKSGRRPPKGHPPRDAAHLPRGVGRRAGMQATCAEVQVLYAGMQAMCPVVRAMYAAEQIAYTAGDEPIPRCGPRTPRSESRIPRRNRPAPRCEEGHLRFDST